MPRFLTLALLAALTMPAAGAHALPQNDAGTGTDAPDTATPSFRVAAGVVHSGTVEGRIGGDHADWYAFDATAGSVIQARSAVTSGCLYLHGPTGVQLGEACSDGFAELSRINVVAPVTGTYYARYGWVQPLSGETFPEVYRFSFAVDAEAPAPSTADASGMLPPRPEGIAPVAPAAQSGDHVVVAVVDTGINPYHDFFSAPALSSHPSTWLPGFPAAATTVPLSLGEPTHAAAVSADAATWAGLQRSAYDAATDTYDAHLYTFPGTRVVAGISFGEYNDLTDPTAVPGTTPVLDEHSHGTHSAGLAGGANLAAADGNVLVVMVEAGQATFDEAIRWAARQPWIDAISLSLGSTANAPHTESLTTDEGMEWITREAHQAGKPVFIAAGNGVSNTALAPDRCTTYTSAYTGPTWVTRIGAAKAENGNPAWWHCVPVDATARTRVDSPAYASLDTVEEAGGTSASTPNAAGAWAHLMLAARRAGSAVTRHEAVEHLLHSASPPPLAVGTNTPSGSPLSFAEQGYGLVDQAALDAATARLLAGSGPAPRPETEEWFARDTALREALWGDGGLTDTVEVTEPEVPELPEFPDWDQWQDDAGSGGDAPDTRSDDVRVSPGVRYGAASGGVITEMQDWYAFDGTAGDAVTFAVAALDLCYDLVAPSGAVLATGCDQAYAAGTLAATLTETGTWYLAVRVDVPQTYSFGFGLNGPAPVVSP